MQFTISQAVAAAILLPTVIAAPSPNSQTPDRETLEISSLTVFNQNGVITYVTFKIDGAAAICSSINSQELAPGKPVPCNPPSYGFNFKENGDLNHYQLYITHDDLAGNTAVELFDKPTDGAEYGHHVLVQNTKVEVVASKVNTPQNKDTAPYPFHAIILDAKKTPGLDRKYIGVDKGLFIVDGDAVAPAVGSNSSCGDVTPWLTIKEGHVNTFGNDNNPNSVQYAYINVSGAGNGLFSLTEPGQKIPVAAPEAYSSFALKAGELVYRDGKWLACPHEDNKLWTLYPTKDNELPKGNKCLYVAIKVVGSDKDKPQSCLFY